MRTHASRTAAQNRRHIFWHGAAIFPTISTFLHGRGHWIMEGLSFMLRRKRPSKPNNLLQDSARASGWPEAPDRLNPENVGYTPVASVSRRMKMDSRPVFLESALLLPLREPATEETQWSPAVFAAIEWRRFEAVCALLFSQGSFTLQSESYGPGLGLLIRLYSQTGGRPVAIVHCRHWQDKRVEEPEGKSNSSAETW